MSKERDSIYDLIHAREASGSPLDAGNLSAAVSQRLAERTAGKPPALPPATSVYAEVTDRLRPSQQHPQRIAKYTLEKYQAETATGESYWVLKDNYKANYLWLGDEQVYLWSLLDGKHTMRELSMAYVQKYHGNPLAVPKAVDLFDDGGFLLDSGLHIYQDVGQRSRQVAAERRPLRRLLKRLSFLDLGRTFSNVDEPLSRLYNAGGHLFYRPTMLAAYLVITLVGLMLFANYFFSRRFDLIAGADSGGAGWSLVALYAAYFSSILLHELAHALTCKHYGREVHRGGFMLYFGLPAVFVDTDDMWLADRKARVMVSWAGPLSTLVVAGVCSITLFFLPPGSGLASALYALAFTSYLNSFFNLNPLLELDGYFMLMDWLELPQLRRRAFTFVNKRLVGKLLRRESFDREGRIFTIFGVLAAIYAVITVWLALSFFAELARWLATPFGSLGDNLAYAIALALLLLIYRQRLLRLLGRVFVRREGRAVAS